MKRLRLRWMTSIAAVAIFSLSLLAVACDDDNGGVDPGGGDPGGFGMHTGDGGSAEILNVAEPRAL